jgi:hypothetical protein
MEPVYNHGGTIMSTLRDFGFDTAEIPSEQARVEKVLESAIKKPFCEPKKQVSMDSHDPDQGKYNTEYILVLISKDRYIFDLRGWPRGINRVEFDKLWDSGFKVNEEGFFWNSGHFSYAIREAKRLFRADKELIWKAIELNKERQVRIMADDWKRSALGNIKYAKDQTEPKDVEQWQKHALNSWALYNQCLKELGVKEETAPPEFTEPISCNPMSWGEKKIKKKTKGSEKEKL